jgi:hypothetical protein
MDTSTIISIVSLGLCALFFIYCNTYMRRRTGQERILAEFKDEVSKLIAEIDVATDRDATLIEDRIKTIRTLLDDVDKRILLYDQEVAKRRANEDMYAELGRKRLVEARVNAYNSTVQNAPEGEAGARPLRQEEHEEYSAESGEQHGTGEDQPQEAPHTIHDEQKSALEQIAELSKAGFSPNLIAARLGMSISEVELAIAIAEQRS